MKPNPLEMLASSRAICSCQHQLVGEKKIKKKKYLGSGNQVSKSTEGIVKSLFIHHAIQIAHKQLCAHLNGLLLICRCLTNTHQPTSPYPP